MYRSKGGQNQGLTMALGPIAKRIAAAEPLGRSSGETVNKVWNESGVRTGGRLPCEWVVKCAGRPEDDDG